MRKSVYTKNKVNYDYKMNINNENEGVTKNLNYLSRILNS